MSPLAFGAFRLRPRTSAFIAATLLLAWVFSARPSISAPVPYEQTTVAELLRQEIQIHALPPDMISLAKAAVETSASAAERVSRLPADRQTALRALGEINIQLARMNFLQPLSEDLWANALSEALTPHDANDSAVVLALESSENQARRPYFDPHKPAYWVQCQTGALFFIAVGERLGWDIRLASMPLHNYVRFHLSNGQIVNWDWTDSRSLPDDYYRRQLPAGDHWVRARVFAVSMSHREMVGYYLDQLGTAFDSTPEGVHLMERAIGLNSLEPHSANNLAWAYATHPNSTADQRTAAVGYALQSWATNPDDPNVEDTVACAFAAVSKYSRLAQRIPFSRQKRFNRSCQKLALRRVSMATQSLTFRCVSSHLTQPLHRLSRPMKNSKVRWTGS